MAIQISSEQIKSSNIITSLIANEAVTAAKLDQTDTFDFSGGSLSVATPTADAHAVTKAYADGLIAGLKWKDAGRVATTSALAATYNNGSSGVGATLTASSNGAITVDGVALSANDRVLVKDQGTGKEAENGLYKVTTVGDVSTAFVLTRTDDADTPAKIRSMAIFIEEGTTNADAGFNMNADGVSAIGTDDITFAQFSGAGSVTAGDGLSKTGNTLSVNLATDPGLEFSSGALKAKVDGSTLGLDSSGLKVAAGGVGTTELGAAAVTQAKIATAAVGSSQLASNAVTAAKLADGAVSTAAKLASGVVVEDKIASTAVTSTKIANNAVQAIHLNSDVINSAGALGLDPTNNDLLVITDGTTLEVNLSNELQIKAGGVGSTELASNAVTAAKIASNAVVEDKIASTAVTSTKIANNAVQAIHLNSDVINSAGALGLDPTNNDLLVITDESTLELNLSNQLQIKSGGVGSTELASNAVTAAKIASNAVVSDKIASSAVTSTKIANNAVQAIHLNSDVINSAGALGLDPTNNDLLVITDDSTLEVNLSNELQIKAGGVGSTELASNAVTAVKIASNAIVEDKIASNAVTATKIANGAIDNANKLGSSVVTNAKIADGTIELGKLAFSSQQEKFTGDGSTTSFDLSLAAAGLDSVCVYRNGLRMEKAASPSGADQYSVSNGGAGGVGQIVFGSAPDSGDVVLVDFLG